MEIKKGKEPELEELIQMKARELDLENPPAHPYWKKKILWLAENDPENTWSQFQRSKRSLYRKILLDVETAARLRLILTKKGEMQSDQIEEVIGNVLTPLDGPASLPNPPKPLKDKQTQMILAWSQEKAEAIARQTETT